MPCPGGQVFGSGWFMAQPCPGGICQLAKLSPCRRAKSVPGATVLWLPSVVSNPLADPPAPGMARRRDERCKSCGSRSRRTRTGKIGILPYVPMRRSERCQSCGSRPERTEGGGILPYAPAADRRACCQTCPGRAVGRPGHGVWVYGLGYFPDPPCPYPRGGPCLAPGESHAVGIWCSPLPWFQPPGSGARATNIRSHSILPHSLCSLWTLW